MEQDTEHQKRMKSLGRVAGEHAKIGFFLALFVVDPFILFLGRWKSYGEMMLWIFAWTLGLTALGFISTISRHYNTAIDERIRRGE